jgi:membrane fusion protein (multidrug efflux system)
MTDSAGPPAAAQGTPAPPAAEKKGLAAHPVLLVAGLTALAVAIVIGVVIWLHARNVESTDDAFIDTRIVRLAPQVSGRIAQVLVNDNQQVAPGQLLAVIDPADSQTHVAQAQADTSQAQAAVKTAKVQIAVNRASWKQAVADVATAAAQADLAMRDLARYRMLQQIDRAAVAGQQIDQAVASAQQTAAQHTALQQAAGARAAQITASQTQVAVARAKVQAAQAALQAASLNFGYTRIVASIAGHIAQDSLAIGDYVQPGTQVLAIVPLDLWITANFKETQLALMHAGQRVSVAIDACPGVAFAAHVDSIQRGAGQAFAILPAENATGNYVKVVQRVPVKIVFDQAPNNCLIGPGMSVEPTVRVR